MTRVGIVRNPSRLVGDDFVLVVFQLGTNCFEFSDTLPRWKKSQLGLLTPSGFPFFFFLGKGYKFVCNVSNHYFRLRSKRKALKKIRLFLHTRWKNVTKVVTVDGFSGNGFAVPLFAFSDQSKLLYLTI